jgi:hypothetical protein
VFARTLNKSPPPPNDEVIVVKSKCRKPLQLPTLRISKNKISSYRPDQESILEKITIGETNIETPR